jgi:hypothetical protein
MAQIPTLEKMKTQAKMSDSLPNYPVSKGAEPLYTSSSHNK